MFDLRRLAVELMLVARPSANLDSLPESVDPVSVTDGTQRLGEESEGGTPDKVRAYLLELFKKGQLMVNVCSNRIPVTVHTPHGRKTMKLTFKSALSYGKRTARRWFQKAVGPARDELGKPIGLSQAARTRLRADLVRGLISRREATFLGIQSALAVSTKFHIVEIDAWDGFRHELFKACYECNDISAFGKRWKKFTTAVQNSLLANQLQERPRDQLEELVRSDPFLKLVCEVLLRAGCPVLTGPKGTRERIWMVAHLTQSRFLPGPSRKQCLESVVELRERLCGLRPDGTSWRPTQDQLQSIELACHTVGAENRESRYAKVVQNTHLSLSNSACLEYTRKEGGKLAILWEEFRDFLDSKVSSSFGVQTKQSEDLSSKESLLKTVTTAVNARSPLQAIPGGISPRERYTKGDIDWRERLRRAIEGTDRIGQIPLGYTLDDLHRYNNPSLPQVFSDHPMLAAFLPPTLSMDRIADAYQLAMISLEEQIKRLTRENTGVFDAIGNEICPIQWVDLPIWKIAYLTEPIEASHFSQPAPLVDAEGKKVLDLRAGIDSRLGMLLFLWSETKYKNWVAGGKLPLPVDPIPISEPGVKARIATKSLIWINLYLSPASHFIKDTMLGIPGCRVGLKGSDHAWNFEASFGRHSDRWKEIESISTSDLTAATDWLEHDMGARAMKAFLDGRFPESDMSDYLRRAVDLVCSPRLLVETPSCFKKKAGIRNTKVYKQYRQFDPEKGLDLPLTVEHEGTVYRGYVTSRGILMGEPLTKMILSLMSIAAERAARAGSGPGAPTLTPLLSDYARSQRKIHQYACAGDDHIGIGKTSYLKMIPQFLQSWSGEISWDKYCISQYGAHYCQDFLIKPEPGPRYALRPLSHLARQGALAAGPKFKLDHVMLRLLSDRRKVGSAVFEETNPFPGKAKALTELMSWAGWDLEFEDNLILLQKLGLGRWFPAAYLKDPRSFVPQAFGGRGLRERPGIATLLSPALRYCIANSDDLAVRIANGSGDSRRLRGVILDDSDKALARLQALNVPVYTREEASSQVSFSEIASYGDMSLTSLNSKLREDFVDYTKFDLTEKKVAVIAKAFSGPSILNETQKSYEGRMRSVVRAQQSVYLSRGGFVDTTQVEVAMQQPWAAVRQLFVRRSEVMSLLPRGIIPSFTIPGSVLSGSMNLIEMEPRVLPQSEPLTDVSALTQQDSMSEAGTTNGSSLIYTESV